MLGPHPFVLFDSMAARSSSVDEPGNHVRLVPTTESMCASLPPVAARRVRCERQYERAFTLARKRRGVEFATSTPSNSTLS